MEWELTQTDLGPAYVAYDGGYYYILHPAQYARMLELMEKEHGKTTSPLLQADR